MITIHSSMIRGPWLSWFFSILLGAGIIWLASYWVGVFTLQELRETTRERLSLYHGTVIGALDKYRYLPFVLSRDEDIQLLLSSSQNDQGLVSAINISLDATNLKAESDVVYVMDRFGTTLASSNWKEDVSFVGHNYAFRPYFKDAMAGKEGRFFALGTVSGIPGFYMSHPVRERSGIIGVVVIKVNLEFLQQQWREGGETVFITDNNSVIFLSSKAEWLYKSLQPISQESMTQIRSVRQYGKAKLGQLKTREHSVAGSAITQIDKRDFLVSTLDIGFPDWVLHYLYPVALVRERQQTTFVIGLVLMTSFLVGALFLRERRLKIISSRRALEAEKIKEINIQLEQEITERRRSEQQLRAAQDGLVQAGKLAALGQMSAAIAHEINQPIAAIRTFVASANLLLKRGRTQELDNSLQQITFLTERMGAITGQLKTFARKAPTKLAPVEIQYVLSRAIGLMQPLFSREQVRIITHLPPEKTYITGDEIRLEQVFVNLFRNATDAMSGKDQKEISVVLDLNQETVMIQVMDSGTGMNPEIIEQLYDPFFTTKTNGDGIGLGLSISYGIVTDLGGEILARNHPSGGAEFILSFPLCDLSNGHRSNEKQ
ncbi:sensor histidine kinase [Kiloniella laminariae]|uniref:sensor histidine kinase n=1 Tax=Kiloniella laminariae TaxID=454162 RepID=UPI00036B0ABD|nr:ATP-binding protein [Kiloniella laminariae]